VTQPTYDELWLPIPGFEGFYEVSNQGRVRSLGRRVVYADGSVHTHPGKLLRQSICKMGRHRVDLRANGKRSNRLVHRLVLEAFVGPCPPGMECCHFDDNPSNNCLDNLRWGTRMENFDDRARNGIGYQANQTTCKFGHPLEGANLMPSALRKGKRACYACNRAHGYIRYRKELKPKFQEIADGYYQML